MKDSRFKYAGIYTILFILAMHFSFFLVVFYIYSVIFLIFTFFAVIFLTIILLLYKTNKIPIKTHESIKKSIKKGDNFIYKFENFSLMILYIFISILIIGNGHVFLGIINSISFVLFPIILKIQIKKISYWSKKQSKKYIVDLENKD